MLYLGPIIPTVDLGLSALLDVRGGVYLPHAVSSACSLLKD